jgi:hypothetical protein
MSVGSAAVTGIQTGFDLGLRADAARQHRAEFEREQSSREDAQRRLSKQEDDRYGRLNDQARVTAVEQQKKQVDELASRYVAIGKPVPNDLRQEQVQLQIQLEDMQQQIATSGRLQAAPTSAPMAAPRPNVASAEPAAAAPASQGVLSAAPQSAPAPAATMPSAGTGLGTTAALGPQRGPAGMPQPMDMTGAPPSGVLSAPPPPAVAGGAPPVAAVAAPAASARTPDQQFVTDTEQSAQNLFSQLATGQTTPDKVAPGDLALAVAAATKRDPAQLGQVRQHVNDFEAGMQTGNNGLLLRGINGIFGPQIAQGVGGPSAHGGTITGKEVIGLDPAQSADGALHADKVIPRLRVTTDVMGANGQPLTYDAPMTVNRSTDPNDPVRAVSMADAVNHIGAVSTLTTAMQHPEAQAAIAAGASDPRVAKYLQYYQDTATAGGDPLAQKMAVIQRYQQQWGTDFEATVDRLARLGYLPQTKGAPAQLMDSAKQLVESGAAPDLPTAMGMVQRMYKPSKYGAGPGGVGSAAPAGGGGGGGGAGAPVGGTIDPATGLPQADSKGLIMGLTPRAMIDIATDYMSRGSAAFSNLGTAKTTLPLKQAVMNYAATMMQKAGISPEQWVSGTQQFKADAKSLMMQQSKADAIDSGIDKIQQDIGTIRSTIAKGNAGFGPLLNEPINYLREKAGSPELASYALAVKQVAIEYERLINGGQLSVAQLHQGAQADAQKILNGNMSVAQVNAVIPTMMQEMEHNQVATGNELAKIRQRLSSRGAGGGAAAPAPAGAPTRITGDADYTALPSGTLFVGPDGVTRRKP